MERVKASGVAQLRSAMGTRSDDPRMIALVGELSMKSDRFRQLWARQDVVRRMPGAATLHHPDVGTLHVFREKLTVAGTDEQVLVIYHAEPGSASAEALQLLGSIAATSNKPVRRNTENSRTGRPSPSNNEVGHRARDR